MASAKATLSQMFSWCPLGPRQVPDVQPHAETPANVTGSSTPAERPQQRGVRDDGIVADLRQCEPWRHERLREMVARNDATRIDRLSR